MFRKGRVQKKEKLESEISDFKIEKVPRRGIEPRPTVSKTVMRIHHTRRVEKRRKEKEVFSVQENVSGMGGTRTHAGALNRRLLCH